MKPDEENLGGWIPAVLALIVAACVAVLSVWWGSVNQDEGWYLYAARLVGEGKLPYRDFFFTQGPVLPFLYSALPIHGLLSGRLVTLGFSLAATLMAIAFARQLVSPERRGAVSLAVFALLSCNLYHVYFTTIPKTYAVGSLFVMAGFLLLARGWNFFAAMSFAFASGTRISLVLILGVVGVGLLVTRFRQLHWLWFGLGGVLGLFLVYGLFALDPPSLKGLLAAQAYHAGRGGFDPFFAAGAVSRLARGYLALGAVLFATLAFANKFGSLEVWEFRGGEKFGGLEVEKFGCGADHPSNPPIPQSSNPPILQLKWMAGLSFAAVFLLQMSAPFPYDDYEVPIMPILTVLIAVGFVDVMSWNRSAAAGWFPVLVSGMCAFASPLVQDWMTNGQDRFWSIKKEKSELAQMREVARKMEALDPGGTMLFTQDLYLAVEMERKVPEGLEMGPFSYFPDMSTEEAESLHVMNGERLERLIDSAPCELAAFSGYGFAIEVPKGARTPDETVRKFQDKLNKHYKRVGLERNFGQNHTWLEIFKRNL